MSENTDRVGVILKRLPGMNCGACGFGSCEGLAKAAVNSPEVVKRCVNLSQNDINLFLGAK